MKELWLPADTKHIEEAMDFVIASVKEKILKKTRDSASNLDIRRKHYVDHNQCKRGYRNDPANIKRYERSDPHYPGGGK